MKLSERIFLSHLLICTIIVLLVLLASFKLIVINLGALYLTIPVATYTLASGIFLSNEAEKLEGQRGAKLEAQVQRESSTPFLKQYPYPLSVDKILSILMKLGELMKEGKISRSVFQKLEDHYANELKKSLEEERSVEEPGTEPY